MINIVDWITAKNIMDILNPTYFSYEDNYTLTVIVSDGNIVVKCEINKKDDLASYNQYNSIYKPNEYKFINRLKFDSNGNLQTTANATISFNEDQTPAQTLISNKFNITSINSEVSINRQNDGYNVVYNEVGSGRFYGFTFKLNSQAVIIKVTIDTNIIFEIDCNVLENLSNNKILINMGSITWEKTNNQIMFYPKSPIKYNSEVKIETIANSNSNGRKIQYGLIETVKDS